MLLNFLACERDAGDPLVQKRGNETILVGVTSWGYGCALPKYPNVYVKVSAIREWIKEQTGI